MNGPVRYAQDVPAQRRGPERSRLRRRVGRWRDEQARGHRLDHLHRALGARPYACASRGEDSAIRLAVAARSRPTGPARAATQRPASLVLDGQVVENRLQPADLAFTGGLRDDVTLGIDEHESRPGVHGVVLPQRHIRVVADRVPDLEPRRGVRDGGEFALVTELG